MMFPDIDPSWRTDTVIALCQSMREARDYSALPILADALQDAGCSIDGLLEIIRSSPPVDTAYNVGLVATIMSAESAAAVKWMQNFAGSVGYSLAQVLIAGTKYQENDGETFIDPDGKNWDAGNALNDREQAQTYWRNYALVTGTTPKLEPELNEEEFPYYSSVNNPFTCPC